jgi:hypothetical protein
VIFCLSGCAGPRYYQRDNISAYYNLKSGNQDFKDNFVESKDITSLKARTKEYIALNPQMNDNIKVALENLKVVPGMSQEQAKFLLGEPDKVQTLGRGNRFKANERWVYKKVDLRCVYVVPLPLFFTNDSFRLYFKDGILAGIEEVKVVST